MKGATRWRDPILGDELIPEFSGGKLHGAFIAHERLLGIINQGNLDQIDQQLIHSC
jgi:hypothetical protein